jgi:hypothetical protein
MPKALLAVFGLLAIGVAVRFFLTRHHEESAQELAELALRAGDPADQEQAATRLAALASRTPGTESRNPVQPFLIRVFNESDNPGVRASMMRALAAIWDYDCMPKMLDLLQDPSLQVRDAAAQSVAKLIDVRFDPTASAEVRSEAVKKLPDKWRNFQDKTLKAWQRRLQADDAQH